MDCELDTFLHILKLKGKNFPQKLKMIEDMGIISSRSIGRLNRIRNKIEHEFSIPDIQDIEIYFELVNAFIHTLEGYIHMIFSHSFIEWSPKGKLTGGFAIEYKFKSPPRIEFTFYENGSLDKVLFDTSNKEDYFFVLRVYFLLCRAIFLVNDDYVLEELRSWAKKE